MVAGEFSAELGEAVGWVVEDAKDGVSHRRRQCQHVRFKGEASFDRLGRHESSAVSPRRSRSTRVRASSSATGMPYKAIKSVTLRSRKRSVRQCQGMSREGATSDHAVTVNQVVTRGPYACRPRSDGRGSGVAFAELADLNNRR